MIGTNLEYKPSDERHTGTPKHTAHTPNKGQCMYATFMVTLDDSASQSHGMAHTDVWKILCKLSFFWESFMQWLSLFKHVLIWSYLIRLHMADLVRPWNYGSVSLVWWFVWGMVLLCSSNTWHAHFPLWCWILWCRCVRVLQYIWPLCCFLEKAVAICLPVVETWSRVLSKKLTGPQLVINFLVSCGSQSFITAFRNPATCPCPESCQFHPCPQSHFFKIHYNIILPSVPRCSKWSLSIRSPHQNLIFISPLSYM